MRLVAQRPLPRGHRRDRRPDRAAGQLPRRPPRRHPVRPLDLALGAPADARPRALLAPHAPPLPARRRRRHLRPSRERLRGARIARGETSSRRPKPCPPNRSERRSSRVPHIAFRLLFVGRLEEEKGVDVLLEAWRKAGLGDDARLVLAGAGPLRPAGPGRRGQGAGPAGPAPGALRGRRRARPAEIRTATFLEPWGLVVNEAMHQGTPVIASDAVGAAAGGLVQDGRNGLVAPAGDAQALATRIRALALNPELRERLGEAARRDVEPFSEAGLGRRDAEGTACRRSRTGSRVSTASGRRPRRTDRLAKSPIARRPRRTDGLAKSPVACRRRRAGTQMRPLSWRAQGRDRSSSPTSEEPETCRAGKRLHPESPQLFRTIRHIRVILVAALALAALAAVRRAPPPTTTRRSATATTTAFSRATTPAPAAPGSQPPARVAPRVQRLLRRARSRPRRRRAEQGGTGGGDTAPPLGDPELTTGSGAIARTPTSSTR